MYFTSVQKQNCFHFPSQTNYVRISGGRRWLSLGRSVFRSASRVKDTGLHPCWCVPSGREDLWQCVWVLTSCAPEHNWGRQSPLVKKRILRAGGWQQDSPWGSSPGAVTEDLPPVTSVFRDCLWLHFLEKWFLNLISNSLFRTVASAFHYLYLAHCGDSACSFVFYHSDLSCYFNSSL